MDGREPIRGKGYGGTRRTEDQEHLFVAPPAQEPEGDSAPAEPAAPVRAGRTVRRAARTMPPAPYEADAPYAPASPPPAAPYAPVKPSYVPRAAQPPIGEPDAFAYAEPGEITMANYRPHEALPPDAYDDDAPRQPAFAPPPRFQDLGYNDDELDQPLGDEPIAPRRAVNYYQTALPHDEPFPADAPYEGYQVEEEQSDPARRKRRRKRALRRTLIAVLVLALLGGGAYLGRDWLYEQYLRLTGAQPAGTEGQPTASVAPTQEPIKGYDPAPAQRPGPKAQEAIASITGDMALETVAVTGGSIVQRAAREEGRFDYYLFTETGLLVGFYEDLPADGFLVCENDCFYVAEAPYLIDREGRALLHLDNFAQYTGGEPVLEPLQNGWAIIRDAEGTAFNYVTAEGELLSTLWFAKAFPFLGQRTVAYVDSGNPGAGAERYSLYIIEQSGSAQVWKRTADMDDIVGVACDLAYLRTGELIRLDAPDEPLCVTDLALAYVDCGALVARDPQTGLYGLFVHGEQHYDFAYTAIEPVPCELTWRKTSEGAFTYCAIYGAAYPQPLSHYFALGRDGQTEHIALSTGSTYPVAPR